MVRSINFRCKTPNGPFQIDSLTDQDNIHDLKMAMVNLTGLPSSRLKIMHGYPPRDLDLSDDRVLLGEIFRTSKESLIVSENVSTGPKVSFAPGTSSPKASSSRANLSVRQTRSVTAMNFCYSKEYGRMKRKIVPANNSCLFTAIYFCVSNGEFKPNIGQELRKIIVEKVKEDPVQFNDAILGCPSEEYCARIMQEDVWGGSIELAVLSNHYGVEIVAVDTQNVRLNRFGEDRNYKTRIFLIYDGVHYDSLYFEKSNKRTELVTRFPTKGNDSDNLMTMALELASEARSRGEYTDVKNFKLQCLNCNDRFTGPEEANSHAKETGHINFGEF